MFQKIIKKNEVNFEMALEHFRKETNKLRTGRATPSLVEDLMVDYYGAKSPLKQIASITVPEPRLIVIQPWSADSLAAIEAAIRLSDLNLNPVNDGKLIRLNLPPLNEERRKELVKVLGKKAEEARVAIRRIREEIWEEIQEAQKNGIFGEDDKFKGKEELQKKIDEYNGKIEELREQKEREIIKV